MLGMSKSEKWLQIHIGILILLIKIDPAFFQMLRKASGSRNKTPSLTAFKRTRAEIYSTASIFPSIGSIIFPSGAHNNLSKRL